MRYGFIGAGNMGAAIIRGFIGSDTLAPADICFYIRSKERRAELEAELGTKACTSYNELIDLCDVIVLAVKPNIFKPLLASIAPLIKAKNPLIVSIAAGISTTHLEEMLDYDARIVRIMPNINAQVLHSCTAVCKNNFASSSELDTIINLFSSIGYTTAIPEEQFAIFTAVAGCSPAYVYMFINALAEGALKMGMNKKLALDLAANTLLGSAKMFIDSDKHPMELCDMVCSPGGTTIEGVCTLDEYKFSAGLAKAVEASVLKDKQLANK
jgi:pyrroline-5-carboxylate reductase